MKTQTLQFKLAAKLSQMKTSIYAMGYILGIEELSEIVEKLAKLAKLEEQGVRAKRFTPDTRKISNVLRAAGIETARHEIEAEKDAERGNYRGRDENSRYARDTEDRVAVLFHVIDGAKALYLETLNNERARLRIAAIKKEA